MDRTIMRHINGNVARNVRERTRKLRLLIAVCFMCFGAPTALVGQSPRASAAVEARFTSASGFSLVPPRDWIVATKDQREQLTKAFKGRADLLKGFDSDRMAVILFAPDDPGSNINVIVAPGRVPVEDADSVDKYGNMLRNQYRQMGVKVDSVSVNRRTFGGHQALLADYQVDMATLVGADAPGRMHQWQVLFGAAGKTFIVTCSGTVSSFANLESRFSETLNSIEFQAGALGFLNDLPPWIRNALIGALIGAALSLFPMLFGSKSKKPPPPPTDPG